ncbi:hypothetical protein B0T09DRAFT_181324 [Sordaria sp. MPI-SDFR-AT-0083]|nr:hypothetical protein B0T09DRAFT_181324 [Sordaria sp. MPI-SDFR-AT-0083]
MPKHSHFPTLSLFLLSSEDMLRGYSLHRILNAERAFRFSSECPTRPAIIFCLEDIRHEDGLQVLGLVSFLALLTRIIDHPVEDLSSIPVLVISRYALLLSLLAWLETNGLAREYFQTLSHNPQEDQPPWLCAISDNRQLVPFSDEARRVLDGPPFHDPPGQPGVNAQRLINVVVAKAGGRMLREMARPGQWGPATNERVVAFWLPENGINY